MMLASSPLWHENCAFNRKITLTSRAGCCNYRASRSSISENCLCIYKIFLLKTMKLHLPGKLRTALLACYAVSASLVTTVSSGFFIGGALVTTTAALSLAQQSYAAETIVYEGGILTNFNYGTLNSVPSVGDVTFSKDDNLTFNGDTSLALGGNVTAGIFAIGKDVVLDLSGNGYKLDAAFEIKEGVLRLSNDALDVKAEVYHSNSGRVEIAWGSAEGSLAAQLQSFLGVLDVNKTSYTLGEEENSYDKLIVHGENAELHTQSSNYTMPIISLGDTVIDTGENNTVLTGMLSGFGSVTKDGIGTLTLKANNSYHFGELVVNEGTVRWGMEVDGDASDDAANTLSFSTITVNKDAIFDDSHNGVQMGDTTSVILKGGTLRSFSMGVTDAELADLTGNTYAALLVQGSGTLASEESGGRRFKLLSSLEPDTVEDESTESESVAGVNVAEETPFVPTETTLSIVNGSHYSYTKIDEIRNFHGSITGLAPMDDDHKLYIASTHQDANYKAVVTLATDAFGFVKTGEGEITFSNKLTALDTVQVNEGIMSVNGALTAEALVVSGGNVQAGGNVTLNSLNIHSDGVFATSANLPTQITVNDAVTVKSGGELSVNNELTEFVVLKDLTISGGSTVVKGKLNAANRNDRRYGNLSFVGGEDASMVVNGDVQLNTLSKRGSGNLLLGANDDAVVKVHRNLVMNYGGAVDSFNNGDFSKLAPQRGVVLSYYSGATNVITFDYGRGTNFRDVDYLFADVFDVTREDLAKGINLGIQSSGSSTRVEHFYVSTLGKKGVDYVIEIGKDNYYYLRTLKNQVATTSWDPNWGNVEVSSAPETVNRWVYTSIDDTGLYGSSYDDDGYFIASELVGTNPTGAPGTGVIDKITGEEQQPGVSVFGGAYDSVDPEGATIKRDIWLKATEGNYSMIVGGSRCDTGLANSGWSLEGDTHIYVSEGVESVGSIIGGNYGGGSTFDSNWVGDGYISVYTPGLTASIVGGGVSAVSHIGDSNIFIYRALRKNIDSPDTDFTVGETEDGVTVEMNLNAIIAGLFSIESAQWLGDGKIVVDLKDDTSYSSMVKSIVGGSFVQLSDANTEIVHEGDSTIDIRNTSEGESRLFTNNIVGADYVIDAGVAVMTGDTYVSFSNLGNSTTVGKDGNYFVVGGHMALSSGLSSYSTGNRHEIVGNTHISITNAENGVFAANVVAGNASSRELSWNLVELSSDEYYERAYEGIINGDTYIDIDSGSFKAMVVGGHYYEDFIHDALPDNPGAVPVHPRQGSEPDVLTITGSTNIRLTGGTYRGAVIGASYYDGWDSVTMYTGAVNMNISNSRLVGNQDVNGLAVVGGYYIDEYIHDGETEEGESVEGPYSSTSGTRGTDTFVNVGDINMTLDENTSDGIILGGSYILRSACLGEVRQGNIVLDLRGGTFNDNIYAAGCESPFSSVALTTDSTTVKLSSDVEFGPKVTVSGGYMGSGSSLVRGDTTLEFTSAGRYDNIANTNFIFFDVVKVTEANGYVVLPHNTTLLGDYITKRGDGTLELGVQNKLDMLTVAEGRLKLAANSGGTAEGSKFEQLNLCKGATLDLSAGNCGINGDLVVEGGSNIVIGTGLTPTTIERLIWDDSERVMLTLSALPTGAESYVVELFSGLSKADIVGLDMRALDEGYGVRASQYIDSNVDLTNSYLLLRGDTLVLTKAPRRSIYWEYKGSIGYWMSEDAWSKKDEGDPNTMFNNEPGSDNVVFSNSVATIIVNQEVLPYDIYVENGEYTFTGEGKEGVITPYGSIVLSEGGKATFTEFVKLNTNADTTAVSLLDKDCTLTVNNDIAINTLFNSGSVIVNGSMSIASETEHGGALMVTGDLTVGGNSTFTKLQVEGTVKNNSDYVLTIDDPHSRVGAIDGGIVRVLKGGELQINPDRTPETTTLQALQGSGAVSTENVLRLNADSKIGKLTVSSLILNGTLQSTDSVSVKNDMAVSDSVSITGALTTNSITYNNLVLRSNYAMVDVEQNVYANHGTSQVRMNVDTSMIATKILSDGKEYYLLKCDDGGLESDIVFNSEGLERLEAHNDRYDYSAYTVNDGVVLKADLIAPHLFEDYVAETPNGMTGAVMLDDLYTDASILEQYPDGDLALTMEAINQQLMINNSKEGLDELFAAVAGASIPAMGVAFADDINRQMQAIRNRTTTMGVDQCAVNEDMPYFNAWINAEGGNRSLDEDGTSSGYDLNSWGGTVGFDVDFTPRFTAGIAVSAMYGDYTANAPDDAEGDFDTQYLTAFGRYGYRSWVHTFIASVGRVDATLERTVSHQYGSYRTKGETDGMGFGLMYEVGYVRALNETGTACIQPVMNFSLTKASLDGYTEEDSDAGLKVDDIEMTTFTVGAGARVQAIIGENLYNRASIFECRALAKFRAGDRNAETEVGFAAAAMGTGTVESAEIGAVGIELGAGIVVPLGAENSSVFADVSAEFSTGYTSVNGTVGYRINF